jgi:hypothetical protein
METTNAGSRNQKVQDLALLYSQTQPVGSAKNKTLIVVDDACTIGLLKSS